MEVVNPHNYEVVITKHARERWLERIVDPTRYGHLSTCDQEKCDLCIHLIHDIKNISGFDRRNIDKRIVASYRRAKENQIDDPKFLEMIENVSQYHSGECAFLLSEDGKAIFVILRKPNETPLMLTVLSYKMVQQLVEHRIQPEDWQSVFAKWKHESKMNDRKST